MIRHIVFFKLKEKTEENKQKVIDKIMSLNGKIESLKYLEAGLNFSLEDRAFDVALIADFDNKEALSTYATHPAHLDMLKSLKTVIAETKVVDYKK